MPEIVRSTTFLFTLRCAAQEPLDIPNFLIKFQQRHWISLTLIEVKQSKSSLMAELTVCAVGLDEPIRKMLQTVALECMIPNPNGEWVNKMISAQWLTKTVGPKV